MFAPAEPKKNTKPRRNKELETSTRFVAKVCFCKELSEGTARRFEQYQKKMSFRLLRLAFSLSIVSLLFFTHGLMTVKANAHTSRDRRHNRHGFHSIDSIFVLNLESRNDRLQHINGVMESLGISHHKIVKAIPHSCGILGCGLSHALAMFECIDSNATTCAIFEDDFELLVDPGEANAAVEKFLRHQPASWEVLMLSAHAVVPSSPSEFSHLDIINGALTASGYIVHKTFAPTLLQTFLRAAYRLNEFNCAQTVYAHDVIWKELQQSRKWFALKPLIGKQRASYSDIEKREVDYKVRL